MLKHYWHDKRGVIIILCICSSIFTTVFYLFGLPVRATGYGALLCAAFLLALVCVDYIRFCKQHKTRMRFMQAPTLFAEDLPIPQTLAETDYTLLLQRARAEYRSFVSEADASRTEMMDYYTLWAHQIKTPLSAADLLLQNSTDPQNASLRTELFKIERYVEMVLQYLRMEHMETDLMPEPCKLSGLVAQAVKKYAPLFIAKKISLTLGHLDVTVLSDEKWLCFVVEQLLSNSLKYTPRGSIQIYAQENTLFIQDTGIGIAPQDLPRVFERGFTGFNGHMDQKATGLGLYLCKRIMDKLGHGISITSDETGTCVRLDLYRPALNTNE